MSQTPRFVIPVFKYRVLELFMFQQNDATGRMNSTTRSTRWMINLYRHERPGAVLLPAELQYSLYRHFHTSPTSYARYGISDRSEIQDRSRIPFSEVSGERGTVVRVGSPRDLVHRLEALKKKRRNLLQLPSGRNGLVTAGRGNDFVQVPQDRPDEDGGIMSLHESELLELRRSVIQGLMRHPINRKQILAAETSRLYNIVKDKFHFRFEHPSLLSIALLDEHPASSSPPGTTPYHLRQRQEQSTRVSESDDANQVSKAEVENRRKHLNVNNTTLASLGDTVLGVVNTSLVMRRRPLVSTHELAETCALTNSNMFLSRVMRYHWNWGNHVLRYDSHTRSLVKEGIPKVVEYPANRDDTMGTLLEAVIGAAYLDRLALTSAFELAEKAVLADDVVSSLLPELMSGAPNPLRELNKLLMKLQERAEFRIGNDRGEFAKLPTHAQLNKEIMANKRMDYSLIGADAYHDSTISSSRLLERASRFDDVEPASIDPGIFTIAPNSERARPPAPLAATAVEALKITQGSKYLFVKLRIGIRVFTSKPVSSITKGKIQVAEMALDFFRDEEYSQRHRARWRAVDL